jgi:hypothetical protein
MRSDQSAGRLADAKKEETRDRRQDHTSRSGARDSPALLPNV